MIQKVEAARLKVTVIDVLFEYLSFRAAENFERKTKKANIKHYDPNREALWALSKCIAEKSVTSSENMVMHGDGGFSELVSKEFQSLSKILKG